MLICFVSQKAECAASCAVCSKSDQTGATSLCSEEERFPLQTTFVLFSKLSSVLLFKSQEFVETSHLRGFFSPNRLLGD